jgi:hypothetical protein
MGEGARIERSLFHIFHYSPFVHLSFVIFYCFRSSGFIPGGDSAEDSTKMKNEKW